MRRNRGWEVSDVATPSWRAVGADRRCSHEKGGATAPDRGRLDDRKVLNGILFVLTTGIAWQRLPQELGFGSGMTCWRRLRDWHQAGVWQQLHELLLARLRTLAHARADCPSVPLGGTVLTIVDRD